MGINVFSCVCLYVVQHTGVFALIGVKARERVALTRSVTISQQKEVEIRAAATTISPHIRDRMNR